MSPIRRRIRQKSELNLRSLCSFPIFSFALPLYSFWNMDDANWGNTRVVVGEGKEKKVIADAEDHYDDSMIPLKRFSGTSHRNDWVAERALTWLFLILNRI